MGTSTSANAIAADTTVAHTCAAAAHNPKTPPSGTNTDTLSATTIR